MNDAPAAAFLRQRTVRGTAMVEGVGLHTGHHARARLGPAEPGTGIVFVRADVEGSGLIPARIEHVRGTSRGVTLGNGETIATVEHLLSAAAGLGVDNLTVIVEGPELPALDGSAREYADALVSAEVREQDAPSRVILLGATAVTLGRGEARTAPADGLEVRYEIDLPPPLGPQSVRFGEATGDALQDPATGDALQDPTRSRRIEDIYIREIAPARTWGFEHEAPALWAAGRALGASLDNVLVLGQAGYLNAPRFPDEPARHKVLDLLGDLALLGARVRGRIEVRRGGHALHLALARRIAELWEGRGHRWAVAP